MKNLKALLLPGVLVFAMGARAETLLFANKDTLQGSFLGCDKTGLRWQSPAAKESLIFQTASLTEAKLNPRKLPIGTSQPAHTVLLVNGDELPGTIVSIDDNTMLLDTWYAGRLTIPRAMIRAVTPAKKTNILYQGPNGPGEWIAGEEEPDDEGRTGKCWVYKNGVFTASSYGSIWRDMKLPPHSDIGFDLTLPVGEPDLDMYIYSGDNGDAKNCYLFQFGLGGVSLTRISMEKNAHMESTRDTDEKAMRGEKVRINIRADKDAKKLWLLVNGKAAGEWTDPGGFAGTGTFLKFTSQIEQGALKISNIKVSTWDPAPAETNGAIPGDAPKEDSLLLENQDRIPGKLKSLANGKVVFTSFNTDVTIPFERIEKIEFAGEGKDQTHEGQAETGDVRAYLAGGGNATLAFESWDAKKITAASPDFGKANFVPDAFQRLQFHPGESTTPDDASAEMGDASSSAENPAATGDTLRFVDKDVLHGTFLGWDKAGVRWQSPSAKEPFVFLAPALTEVDLDSRKQPENAAQSNCFVQLVNGDELPGVLSSLNDRKLLLDTWYAGRLTISRDAVKCISTLKDHKTFFYQGPESLEGWTIDLCNGEDEDGKPVKRKPDWTYQNGAFISTGMDVLNRAVDLPAKCSIEFDLDVQSAAFTDSPPQLEVEIGDYKDNYMLNLYNEERHVAQDTDVNKNTFMLRRVSHGKTSATKWPEGETSGSGARREKTHIDLRIDKKARTLWLFINGKQVSQWVDKEDFPVPGKLTFDTMDNNGSYTKISNIKLSEWNGKLDAKPETGSHKTTEDSVEMENADSLSGRINVIADGNIIIATAYSDVTVPLDHVTVVTMAATGVAPAKQQPGEFIHVSWPAEALCRLTLNRGIRSKPW